jgi:hypothetical protein
MFLTIDSIEEYRCQINVDGALTAVGFPQHLVFHGHFERIYALSDFLCSCRPFRLLLLHLFFYLSLRNGSFSSSACLRHQTQRTLYTQLDVLDTAGAEQFTSLNEVYIKVRYHLPSVSLRCL